MCMYTPTLTNSLSHTRTYIRAYVHTYSKKTWRHPRITQGARWSLHNGMAYKIK